MSSLNDQPWFGKGVNIMTPTILGRGRSGDWAWELSEGRGMEQEPIYGCTFLHWDGVSWQDGPSEMRWSEADARAYIAEVCGP